ncbi:regulator of G-protein signaling 7 [Biomphalaria glabrata]|uniref:Regulator of G-protein signaling 7-like isoform X1 n=1 Tax=Biomphalaria glabrata TaxID=6526 RepID=A0A9W2ZSN2_BIOGL|nr:regulator of G-protein signaling 7-like isoform X1 [Biomphalaria glabrata]KAI8766190.1 regulator of G-protein signaling 7-like [Biomphalaria glabrata]
MVFGTRTMDTCRDNKPRHAVYEKMEKLVQEMQLSKSGVPVRSQKTFPFLTFIPSVFTGSDLIQWLATRLKITEEEHMEAVKLAILLCHYGYIFPVTDLKNLTVKEDASLYRFQKPYYWPSKNADPDNVSYAIHLVKRSMRNKQKHGLEDYEQASLTKLQTMLCDKWDFIVAQAQDQVKIAKEKKRTDKAIMDSQERAFWRIHRPPPGCIKTLDEGPKRNFQPSQMAARRKKNKDLLQKEIKYLHRSINICRVKTSKAVENLEHFTEQYFDLDPLLTPPMPSNPWISDDTTYFEISENNTEIPTEQRIRKWSYSLQALISDPRGRYEFENFLLKEYSHENFSFWCACEALKFCRQSEVENRILKIAEEFLTDGAPHQINIDSRCSEEVQKNMKLPKPNRFTFDSAQEQIFSLMKKDTYQRFLRSDQYKALLTNAGQPGGKKKFFSFGSRKKNTLTPSPKPKRRGSAGNDADIDNAAVAHHSYSTGNLRELEDKSAVMLRRDANSSDSSIASDTSPNLVARHSLRSPQGSPRKSKQLEVPKISSVHVADSSQNEGPSCLAIAVPSKTNVVAPWEGVD